MDYLSENVSSLLKQRVKFIEDKVYIGTKDNVNNQYVSRIKEELVGTEALKDELNLLMESIEANVEN